MYRHRLIASIVNKGMPLIQHKPLRMAGYNSDLHFSASRNMSSAALRKDANQKYKHILLEKDGKMMKLTLNRPQKKNAILMDMYLEWMDALDEAEKDPDVVLVAITGAGDYYCAGNDITNIGSYENFTGNISEAVKKSVAQTNLFVKKHIDFPKILVAVVNGPAIGIAVTTLSLFDLVYAADNATFLTPFTKLALCPEGCSSYTFPKLFGPGKASEILLFDKKISSKEALEGKLVTEIFPKDKLHEKVWPKLKQYSELPRGTLLYGKQNIRYLCKDKLHEANNMECELLEKQIQSDECIEAAMNFLTRKSKSKL